MAIDRITRTFSRIRKAHKPKPNGYVLYQNRKIVVIATGFRTKSNNPKTGDMIQVWILPRNVNPVAAVKSGRNSIVCLDCKHAGVKGTGVTCYVRVANAPLGIWKGYHRGIYPKLTDYSLFAGRRVRFGAYGEPVLIPVQIVRAIVAVCSGWTGYTHQWRKSEYSAFRQYLMASVDNVAEHNAAKSDGWRTFRVRSEAEPMMDREIMCPASEEMGKRTTCANCRLCSGTVAGDPRKDIAIVVHGAGAKRFERSQLIQIGKVA